MAGVATIVHGGRMGDGELNAVLVDFVIDTYALNGVPLVPSQCGLGEIYCAIAMGAKGYQIYYDHTTRKVMFFRQTAGTGALVEVPGATDISTSTPIRLLVFGRK